MSTIIRLKKWRLSWRSSLSNAKRYTSIRAHAAACSLPPAAARVGPFTNACAAHFHSYLCHVPYQTPHRTLRTSFSSSSHGIFFLYQSTMSISKQLPIIYLTHLVFFLAPELPEEVLDVIHRRCIFLCCRSVACMKITFNFDALHVVP